ncbi:2-oxo acid dehydrogenase subunit E2 [Bradymonas sediminis]|nr:2-oxo acid dehydrogenase subunit E2 [Bradymonas sediminis]TDP75389.1 2-oxoacid dehydrogenase/acyltransferase catalytic subunit [Bradymonas sediminis]
MSKYWAPFKKNSAWRRISVGMWDAPDDPTIYGYETLDAHRLVPYLEELSRVSGVKVTPAAVFVKIAATVFEEHPDLNVIMVNKTVQKRNSIDIFCQVSIPNESTGQADLSGVKLKRVNEMNLVEIASRLSRRAKKVRDGQDEEMEQTKATINVVPTWLMRPMLKAVDFLTYNVPFDLGSIGVRDDPFGSAMVSSVAAFDIKLGFAPLVPMSRVPMVFLPGVMHKAVLVNEDGEPEVRDVLQASCTFDHRCFDGYQIGFMVRAVREMIKNPRDYFVDPQEWAAAQNPGRTPEAQAAPKPAAVKPKAGGAPRPEDHASKAAMGE